MAIEATIEPQTILAIAKFPTQNNELTEPLPKVNKALPPEHSAPGFSQEDLEIYYASLDSPDIP